MSKLNFSKPTVPVQKYEAFPGRIINGMPDLVASNMKFGNLLDLDLGRMPKHNSDENDREILYNNWFDLAGNPVFSLEKDGEQVIVYDLENKDLKFVKEMVASLNPKTKLNDTYSLDVSRDLYDAIKKADGSFTIKKSLANELRNDAYSNNKARIGILKNIFQGKDSEAKEYIDLVKEHHGVKNINTILGFYPGRFTGMRLLVGGSVGYSSRVGGDDYLSDDGCHLLGVGNGVASVSVAGANARDKKDLEGKIIITPGESFSYGGFNYEMHDGIYLASPAKK